MSEIDLSAIHSLAEFEPRARLAMDPGAFDYVAGGSWDEVSLAENEAAWRRLRLRPRVLVDVSRIDPGTTMLGQPVAMPLAVAPMAAHGLAHPDAEAATARAAAAAGIPFILSTMSTCSIEEVAHAAPDGVRWFQLYTQADPARTRELVERAEAAGYAAIVLTVDLPLLGYRERDRRSGFELEGPHGNFATPGSSATHGGGIHADGFAQLEQQHAHRPLVGRPRDDPKLVVAAARPEGHHDRRGRAPCRGARRGRDRGQQPRRSPARPGAGAHRRPGRASSLRSTAGRRSGSTAACAVATTSRSRGRWAPAASSSADPILWALAAGGQAGVERALAIVREEFEIALALLGTPTPDDIGPGHVLSQALRSER